MDFQDIYALGARTEIRQVNGNSTKFIVYEKGIKHAKAILKRQKNLNTSMTKAQLMEYAGIKEYTDPKLIDALCYARLSYEGIKNAKRKFTSVTEGENYINEKLKKQHTISLLLDKEPTDAQLKMALNARNFIKKKHEMQQQIWEQLGINNEDQK